MDLVEETRTYKLSMSEVLDFPNTDRAVQAIADTMDKWTVVAHIYDYEDMTLLITLRKKL